VRRVVVLGGLNMDLVVEAPRLPVAGETVLGGAFRTASGGKGANQAVAAARVGARVMMIGCVGDDAYGGQLRGALRKDSVDVRHVRRVAAPTGVALIVVQPGGENLIAVAPGANACLSGADIAAAQSSLAKANAVVSQLEVPLETVEAGAAAARAAGVPFVLNAAPAQVLPADLLRQVEVLIANETELAVLFGQHVADGDEAAAAQALLGHVTGAVVVTLGARGALVVERRGATAVPAFRVQAVDATAAGDAFVGGLAARYAGPESLVEAARFGAAAGALACTRAGAQPSLPTLAEVEELRSAGDGR
jgi:ribokinase